MLKSYPYQISFQKPLRLPGNQVLHERKGMLLHDPETGAWGDAAPLPGYSVESLAEVREAVAAASLSATGLPSLRFALECMRKPWVAPTQAVAVNALWFPATESVKSFLKRISLWSQPVVKVKPGAIADAAALLEAYAQRPDLVFRIDGNRQWTLEQTLDLYSALPHNSIDYFEEPLREPGRYSDLFSRAAVPIALDESLLESGGGALAQLPGVTALVLKPTLLGNEVDRLPWIEMASRQKMTITWSSCFESGVGLWHLAGLAQGFGAAGLDTNYNFVRDLVNPRPSVNKGMISVATEELVVIM
ncbi:enolase C-terminal domain-like protein [Kiritimatiellota bacterium B12222]|nr:enolase C-terminal domain-like protein [Kiritimatiellota bacterium B12222]